MAGSDSLVELLEVEGDTNFYRKYKPAAIREHIRLHFTIIHKTQDTAGHSITTTFESVCHNLLL